MSWNFQTISGSFIIKTVQTNRFLISRLNSSDDVMFVFIFFFKCSRYPMSTLQTNKNLIKVLF